MSTGESTGSFKRLARAKASSLTQWPLFVVLGILAAGLVLVVIGHWRRGTVLIGLSPLVGAGLRCFLPHHTVGLLQVRGRLFDAAMLLCCGTAIIVLGLAVPVP